MRSSRLELQISRLPGKGGYSTRPSGTTGWELILHPSHASPLRRESRVNSRERRVELRRQAGGGRKLGVEDVASEAEEAKAA